MNIVSEIVTALQKEVEQLPERFYSSFDYTRTRRTYTHPVTLGLLAKILWSVPSTSYVGIDVRLNVSKDVKFQPDLVVFDRSLEKELLYADYESPNSCDSRIPHDIAAYQAWRAAGHRTAPYLLITTLPSCDSPDWELRYAARGQRNHPFKQRLAEMRQNPFKFWYSHYADAIQPSQLEDVHFINIEGRQAPLVDWSEFAAGGLTMRAAANRWNSRECVARWSE